MCGCVCLCAGVQRPELISGIFYLSLSTVSFETGSFTGLDLARTGLRTRLVGWWPAGILLSPVLQPWDYRLCASLSILWGSWGSNLGPCAYGSNTLLTDLFSPPMTGILWHHQIPFCSTYFSFFKKEFSEDAPWGNNFWWLLVMETLKASFPRCFGFLCVFSSLSIHTLTIFMSPQESRTLTAYLNQIILLGFYLRMNI